MRLFAPGLLSLVTAFALPAVASDVACRFAFDATPGSALFSSNPREAAARCAAELAHAPSVQALDCLLLVHDAAGITPTLPQEARSGLERVVRDTPSNGPLDYEPRIVGLAAEVLALAGRDTALPLLHGLLEPPAARLRLVRAARLAPRIADEAALQQLALQAVSPDAELRRGVLRGLARTGAPAVLDLLVPMLSDPDERLATVVLEGLVDAPRAPAAQLRKVLVETPRSRRTLLANALTSRLEPRAGRNDVRDDVLATTLRESALAVCDDRELTTAFVTASVRTADTEGLEAWRMLGDDVAREAPIPCAAWRRPLGLALLERAGFERDPVQRAKLAATAARYVARAPRSTFDPLEHAMARRLDAGEKTPLASWLADPARVVRAVETVRWGGGPEEAALLRAHAKRAFTEVVPGCTSLDHLSKVFVAIVAAEGRSTTRAQRR